MAASGPYRLRKGGQIDRASTLSFCFNGRPYHGFEGDSLASALLANGVRTVARSFKFRRPRGVFSCGVEEPNALLQIGSGARRTPAVRAPMTKLLEGTEAQTQRGWPSVEWDVGRALDWVAPLFPAGFYNKTFLWPNWHMYEHFIRRLAGHGWAPTEPDPDRYDVQNLHCDVLVVGGGIAGLLAARDAAAGGARIVLAEQDWQFGGKAAWARGIVEGRKASEWIATTVAALQRLPKVCLLMRTVATGAYDHQVYSLLEQPVDSRRIRERYWIVRAREVVLATGLIEQPLIFEHNDRPGIMLASAAHQYLLRYGVAPGRRVVIATNNDSVYALLPELMEAGVQVAAIVDSRAVVPSFVREGVLACNVKLLTGWLPIDTRGFSALRRVWVGRLNTTGDGVVERQSQSCDALLVSGGFNSALSLWAQTGGRLNYHVPSGSLQAQSSAPGCRIVGDALLALDIGQRVAPIGDPARQWVDLLHDVTVSDLQLALRENYTHIEHVKRYTTVGMAPDQGRTSVAPALEVVGKLRGISPSELGHTALRPPATPTSLGAIVGRECGDRFAPYRELPLHAWHLAHGAIMQEFSEWRRPVAYLGVNESREEAADREARAVRTSAGLLDGSSLGKIEIHGPDAWTFVDLFYLNDLSKLVPRKIRYGLMLRENGTLLDDGTVTMIAADHFLVTTTSSQANRIYQWMEEWRQCEWPNLKVAILPVTEAWATLSIAGPRSREILSQIETNIDFSAAAFPPLTFREGFIVGRPGRISRVSFTGEVSYEVSVPTETAAEIWKILLATGDSFGLVPFGLDALDRLRLEKGFLHIGTDTDGTTVPDDVGWGASAAQKPGDFIGKRSLQLPENRRGDRRQLVGLKAQGSTQLRVGCHLRVAHTDQATDGWITSAARGVMTDGEIALGLLRAGRGQMGRSVDVYDAGVCVGSAHVVSPPFFDPTGTRVAQ